MENKLMAYGKPFKLTAKEKKERALKYALSLVTFQEIGAGADELLNKTRTIADMIRQNCFAETGIKLESYPTDYLNKNIIKVLELLPYGVKKKLEIVEILKKL